MYYSKAVHLLLLQIFNNVVDVREGNVRELFDYITLLNDSLENEFVIDMSCTPVIDLTSVYFDHKRVDLNEFIMNLAIIPPLLSPMERLYEVASDVTTRDLQTCEGVYYPNFRMFKLFPEIIVIVRGELELILASIRLHFNIEKRK